MSLTVAFSRSLELARVLSQFTFKSTIMLVAVTGEEQGLHGSTNLAEKFAKSATNIEAMITLDVIGNSSARSGNVNDTSVRVFSEGPVNSKHRLFASFIKAQGEANIDDFFVNFIPERDRGGRRGDHIPFSDNGFTSARLTEPEDNSDHQHNDFDTVEFMDFPYLTKNVKLIAAVLAGLADAPPIN